MWAETWLTIAQTALEKSLLYTTAVVLILFNYSCFYTPTHSPARPPADLGVSVVGSRECRYIMRQESYNTLTRHKDASRK